MPQPTERQSIQVRAERAVLAAVRLPESSHDPRDPFGELQALAEQGGAIVVGEMTQNRDRPDSATFMGKGKVDELRGLCEGLDASTIIFDHDLSPSQIGNIEEITGRKVIDRSELILDIFASRATTHEAKLQVELAQLEYTYPRLRAMWDHLERIVGRGGIGGIGTRGPGEQQLEIDRRLVQQRSLALQRQLAEIQSRKRREVRDRKLDHFTVGLVGYTNAGKSTLFNTLTAGGAYADDRLFATLTTRTREWDLSSPDSGAHSVMLSDTVGFVRDLPHSLVASFKATLEEATHADVLLIVLDVSDPAAELHARTVMTTLDELDRQTREAEPDAPAPKRMLLLNKCDRLPDNREVLVWQARHPGAIPICAVSPSAGGSGLGLDALRALIRHEALGPIGDYELSAALRDSRTITRIEKATRVLDRTYTADEATFRVRAGARVLDRLRAGGSKFELRRLDTPRPGLALDHGAPSPA